MRDGEEEVVWEKRRRRGEDGRGEREMGEVQGVGRRGYGDRGMRVERDEGRGG